MATGVKSKIISFFKPLLIDFGSTLLLYLSAMMFVVLAPMLVQIGEEGLPVLVLRTHVVVVVVVVVVVICGKQRP